MNVIPNISIRHVVKYAVLMLFSLVGKVQAQVIDTAIEAKEIIRTMNSSTDEWNKGHLDAFMNMYDPSATMMMSTGPVGIQSIRGLYEKKYFNGSMPKQSLRYSDMQVRFLGSNYALLTGAFTLYGNNLPDRSGRYSIVMVHGKNGWKILHDHSG
ncbi:ketosteroid isomerase-like protein [Mucilaginibacter frigoritolerans]|jgi:ketosteroid isomerase-like protein|uniref:Ketosteroid isomerase-like protein n=1 Tax=Mucilaginibacter frigoritolerans TaxID=652788 RepID=A0A562U808_9SPHI|nr:nuclear transport factor 2 family protein [Mucilaginibacter frigoritolerans]TWJ01525.1 ketosteroid isomerase-like protein [Mucilaginibacter frigoritolerans]